MKLPILILTRCRPLQLRDMVDSIRRVTPAGAYRIIICDNDSRQPEMIELLKELESDCTVIRNGSNLVFEGLNPGLKLIQEEFFVISDPDIILNPLMPRNWIDLITGELRHSNAPKIGVALKIHYPESPVIGGRIKQIEKDHWVSKAIIPGIHDACYYAAIDTTFAVYRRDTFPHWQQTGRLFFSKDGGGLYNSGIVMQFYSARYGLPIRVAGCFTAEHGGWYANPKYYPDYEWYKKHCAEGMSSSLLRSGDHIELVINGRVQQRIRELEGQLPPGFGPDHPRWGVPSYQAKIRIIRELQGRG